MSLHYKYYQLASAASMTGNINSFGIDLNQTYLVAFQAVWTGAPTGTLQIQISCDNVQPINAFDQDPAGNVVNWTTITGSQVALAGTAGTYAWPIQDLGFRWVRAQYVFTSGTGSLLVQANSKGP